MRADYHVHTEFSDDSDYPMEKVIKDAITMGLDEICFTDHVDYGIKKDWDEQGEIVYRRGTTEEPDEMPLANVHYSTYYETFKEMRALYGDEIALKLGLEFGMQAHTIEKYERLFARFPFDFIILSVHEVEDKEFWTQDFQRGRTQQEYNERYYEELLYLVQNYHNYSVLGHIDLVARYDNAGIYPFKKLEPILTDILRTVIADGKGIEVNTFGRRHKASETAPSRDILKLYRKLGGHILTIGSNSHKPEHLGAFIDETKLELKTLGFKEFCTFDKMTPVYHQL
jgi:histidinol-phosphatase (PHP family)